MLEPSTIAAPTMIRRAVIMISAEDHRHESALIQAFPDITGLFTIRAPDVSLRRDAPVAFS